MKSLMADKMLDRIEDVAPGDDFAQGLLQPSQFLGNRPVPGWIDKKASAYETPLANRYMAGGGCHAQGPA